MKMSIYNSRLFLFTALACMVLPASEINAGRGLTYSGISVSELQPGEYLRSDIVDALEQKHSLYAVRNTPDYIICQVENRSDYVSFSFRYFSSSGGAITIKKYDKSKLIEVFELKNIRGVSIVDANTFSITWNAKTYIYRNVKDVDHFVSEKTIVGSYVDSAGRTYIFTKENEAIWPDRRFKYIIDTMMEGSDRDRFFAIGAQDPKDAGTYGFLVKGDNLYIWKNVHPDPQLDTHTKFVDPPFLVLKRVQKGDAH